MKRLWVPKGANGYCVPWAFAVALRIDTDQAERRLNAARRSLGDESKKRKVGFHLSALRRAFERRSVPFTEHHNRERITLGGFLAKHAATYGDAVVIVRIRGHVVVMCRGFVSDNGSKRWIDASEWKSKIRCPVTNWFIVGKVPPYKKGGEELDMSTDGRLVGRLP